MSHLSAMPGHDYRLRVHRITPSEAIVLRLMAQGKGSKEIAVALNIATKTAETHRANINRKLEVSSAVEAVLLAIREGLVACPCSHVPHDYSGA